MHTPCRHYFIIVNNSLYYVNSFFPHFLAIYIIVTMLGNAHRPCKQCINIIEKSLHHVYSFSPDLFWFSYSICMNYHIRKCTQTMWTIHHHCGQWSLSCYSILFWSFPDVLGIFASITILGNMHRPCKQYLNLVNNSLHHVYSFFSWVFLNFFLFFY